MGAHPKYISEKIKCVTINYVDYSYIKFKGRQKLQYIFLKIYVVNI